MLICDKYKPQQLNEFLGLNHITENDIQLKEKEILVIIGESGSGKTSLTDYIIKYHKFKEINIDHHSIKSIKNLLEIFNNTQYTFHVKTCIVFSDFECIMNDNVYNNTIIQNIKKVPHNVIFTVHSEHFDKFERLYKIDYKKIYINSPSKAELSKYIRKIAKIEKIQVDKTKIEKCLKNLPDIRKTLENLIIDNEKNVYFHQLNTKISNFFNGKFDDMIYYSDMFHTVPLLHENYIKYCKKINISEISSIFVYADIIQTRCYKTQQWNQSIFIMMLLMNIIKDGLKKRTYKSDDLHYGKILSRMSNKQTKYNIFKRLYKDTNSETTVQLYLCKRLNPSIKLLQNQFL